MVNTTQLRLFCEELVTEGGELSLEYFQTTLQVTKKPDKSLVSKADTTIEKKLIARIQEKYPDHDIFGEETGGTLESDQPIWIIDPIEGTTNFLHGTPIFGTQLAVMHQGKIIAAAMYEPVSNALVSAIKNEGAFFQGSKIALDKEELQHTTLLFDTGRDQSLAKKFLKSGIIEEYRSFRRLGSLVTDVIFLTKNTASVYLGFTAKIYDLAPAALILSEAGYRVVDESLDSWTPKEVVSLFAFHPYNSEQVISQLKRLKK